MQNHTRPVYLPPGTNPVEFSPEGESLAELPVTSETVESEQEIKRKNDQPLPPLAIWNRPFPDPAGYSAVDLYVDRTIADNYSYVLMFRWETKSSDLTSQSYYRHTRTIRNDDYETPTDAELAGLAKYKSWCQEVIDKNNARKPLMARITQDLPIILLICYAAALILDVVASAAGQAAPFIFLVITPPPIAFLLASATALVKEDYR